MKRTSNPCAATCPDGSKCGRRAPLGEQFCSIHKAKALGQTIPGSFQPKPKSPVVESPEDIVRGLMRDPDAGVRLRAVEMFQKHFERRQTSDDTTEWVKYATDSQMDALREFLAAIKMIRESVLRYIQTGGMMRADHHPDYVPPDIAKKPDLNNVAPAPIVTEPKRVTSRPTESDAAVDDTYDDIEIVSDDDQ